MAEIKAHNRARNLRKSQTPAEQLLWSKLHPRGISGYKFRRQHPIKPYFLDFYCCEAQLAIEVDGAQHSDAENRRKDHERTSYLNEKGVQVLRFWNNEVLENQDEVLAEIDASLGERTTTKDQETV